MKYERITNPIDEDNFGGLSEIEVTRKLYRAYSKLIKHEDIEERYGIEILTMFKAMVDGCYYLYRGKIEHFIPDGRNFICPNLDNGSMDLMYSSSYGGSCRLETCLPFSAYGKKWALTKEVLE